MKKRNRTRRQLRTNPGLPRAYLAETEEVNEFDFATLDPRTRDWLAQGCPPQKDVIRTLLGEPERQAA